jgi:glycosyltransferase involved in cell wall biosynthesis
MGIDSVSRSRAGFVSPPGIAPLAGGPRPFWSVMIPVYNCDPGYLRETLQSVLDQDPGAAEMQIEVIDNCSTEGDVESLVREIGRGRIDFFRQPTNLGIVGNFNACIQRSRGQWVQILHGDDIVRPGFYARAGEGIAQHPEAAAAFCRLIYIDEAGHWKGFSELEMPTRGLLDPGFAERQFIDQRIQFVSIVVRRSTYEELGGFRASLAHCLDWDMWKRVAARKPIFFDPEPLACFRLHAGADTSRLVASGENVVDERRSIDISCADVSAAHRPQMKRIARRAAGVRAARRARYLWKQKHVEASYRQAAEAMRCSLSPAVLARVAYVFVSAIVR